MAETERTFAELQTLLADNTSRAVSPQDQRDSMVSALGGYAGIYLDGGAVALALVAAAAKIDPFTANGPARGLTPDHANGRITVGAFPSAAAIYQLRYRLEGVLAIAATVDVELRVAGVKVAGFTSRAVTSGAGQYVALAGVGLVSLAPGENVELYASGTPDVTLTARNASLAIKRAG